MKKLKIISLIICFVLILFNQLQGQTIQQELKVRGLTLKQAQQLAQTAGVDPNNPTELANFARQNGVSEAQIQEFLSKLEAGENYTLDPNVVVDVTEASVTSDQITEQSSNKQNKRVSNPRKTPEQELYFGYDIFSKVGEAFLPNSIGPVDEGYIVGPDDELRLTIWGATELQYELAVDAEGRTFIPTIGLITVAGQSVTELRKSLKQTLSRSYSGLTKKPATVFMDVTVTRFKPIEIFVLGEVNNPGGYTFTSNSSLFNVLYGVGGPKISGSLRDVRIIRKGKVIASVDFYEMLLKGIDPSTVPLLNNDRIFIPPRKSTISIKGPVFREGIYELKDGETVNNLIRYAGELLPEIYGDRFQINRIVPLEQRIDPTYAREKIDYDLNKVLNGDNNIILQDGDKLTLFSISDISDNYVKIIGGVNQPGTYQLDAGITNIKDLIMLADNLQDDALNGTATLTRTRDDSVKFSFNFDVKKALENNPAHNLSIKKRDVVQIFENNVQNIKNKTITIQGEVKNPGVYSFSDGMNLETLLLKAGGFKEVSYVGSVEVTRNELIESDIQKAVFIEYPLLNDDIDENIFYSKQYFELLMENASKFQLMANDQVFIRKNPKFQTQERISVEGEILYPGDYTILYDNELLSDIIKRAGGLTLEAYPEGARLIRNEQDVVIELGKILGKDKNADVLIRAGDKLFIPKRPNAVLVTGNVELDGYFKYKKGKRFTYYLNQAGGLQPNTYKYLLLTQANGATYRVKRKGIFRDNPVVEDGAAIRAVFEPEKPPSEKISFKEILDETVAAITSALTIYLLLDRL